VGAFGVNVGGTAEVDFVIVFTAFVPVFCWGKGFLLFIAL
jgi:hypothetical protein